MEFLQGLIMLILAIGFNGGVNGEILPPGATLIPPGQYKTAEEVFSGEDQYKAYSEAEDGTIIMNPMYQNAWGPAYNQTNQADPEENGTGMKLEALGTSIKLFADVSKSFFELLHNPQRFPSFANLGKIDSTAI